MATIKELETKVAAYADAYYNAEPLVSDAEFDALVDQLRALKPTSKALKEVGAASSSAWSKATHSQMMGSQMKASSPEEFRDWARKTGTDDFTWSEKLDGSSVSLVYRNGKFVQAITRGDGREGDDITPNVARMQNVPKNIRVSQDEIYVRAEILMSKQTFVEKYEGLTANPRNAAAGIARRLDGKGCEDLQVVAFDVEIPGTAFKFDSSKFEYLSSTGFRVAAWGQASSTEVEALYNQYISHRRDDSDFEIDGLVVRVQDMATQTALGVTDNRPKGQRAFKFPAAGAWTTVLNVTWQTGRQGKLAPVVLVEPVNIGGVVVSRVNGNNLKFMHDKGVSIGGQIFVVRRGDVIPYIDSGKHAGAPIDAPWKCGACGAPATFDGTDHRCDNDMCNAQECGRLLHFLVTLNVKGFGEVLVAALNYAGVLRTPVDFFKLSPGDIGDIEGFSEKVGVKLMREFMNKAGAVTLPQFVELLSIPGIGDSVTELLSERFPTIDALRAGTASEFVQTRGVGDELARKLEEGLAKKAPLIDALLEHLVIQGPAPKLAPTGSKCAGWVVIETGVRRMDLMTKVLEQGGTVARSMSSKVTVVVAKDPSGGSSKLKKAREGGARIMSVEELEDYLR